MKLLKRRLDYCWFVVILASLLNRDKDKSLVFVPFQNSLLGLVFLLQFIKGSPRLGVALHMLSPQATLESRHIEILIL